MQMSNYKYFKDLIHVNAVEINNDNLGKCVQELLEDGATFISVDKEIPEDMIILVFIRGRHYSVRLGDYLVEEETEFGLVKYPVKKEVFECCYTHIGE